MGVERRKYYRYPATPGSETVIVRHQGVERPARLINQSSDGFRLDLDEDPIVEVGDVVLMATSSGFHRVCVVNLARENGTLQLGLKRLEDLPASAVKELIANEEGPRREWTLKAAVSNSFAQLAIPCVLGAMVVAGAIWAWTSESDPVGAVVDGQTFVTPTSDYSAKRRRHTVEKEAASPRPEQPTWRYPTAVADDASHSSPRIVRSRSILSSESTPAPPSEPAPAADDTDGVSLPAETVASTLPVFDSTVDATVSIKTALKTANRENKRVLVEFGGQQCDSCSRLNAVFTQDTEIAATVRKAFVLVLVDMQANQKLVSRYLEDELRERVPFLALLNKEGKVLKRRRTDDLEAGSKLDRGKVKEFLGQWLSAG
jgi:hypothetical protein